MKIRIIFLLALLFFSAGTFYGQKAKKNIVITGHVTDANFKPIANAILLIDNKKADVLTDEKGFYKIRIKSSAKTITAVTMLNGMAETEINGRTIVDLVLRPATASQVTGIPEKPEDETVNVGYGTANKKDLTTSVGKINATEKDYGSYKDIYEMIRGKVPGVQVNGNKILIRGEKSINAGNDPLLVVDGIIVNAIDDIPPKDVKSIEILKGSDAAIYGSRGANGVILITLRKAGDK
jgi:TonB-dependent starch-binding outer membrane protein SusC